MSEMGQTQKSECATGQSALPSRTDVASRPVRSEKCHKETSGVLGVGITEGASFLYRDYFSDNQSGRSAGC
jgi:hypothetical protein